MIEKIISGGQTGADMGGLLAARDLGIPTGGWAPKGWVTEDGPKPELAEFGLVECSVKGYPARTKWNIRDSDATVIYGDIRSPGNKLTFNQCHFQAKPVYVEPTVEELATWLVRWKVRVLNVAGSRASKNSLAESYVREHLIRAIKALD